MRKDYAANGSNISLAIDSNLLDTNPLFRVWKTKSFTDNDIVLHFLILDLLQNGHEFTAKAILDACNFYQMAELFGIAGNELTEQFDYPNRTFRVKHSFFVHTLEDEILLKLLNTMVQKQSVKLEMKSSRRETLNTAYCIPLKIFISTRSGRRFLCGYISKLRSLTGTAGISGAYPSRGRADTILTD